MELGYITEIELKKRFALSAIGLFVSVLIFVPIMVYCINGASNFWSAFWQMTVIFMVGNIFDRIFIDEFWVGHGYLGSLKEKLYPNGEMKRYMEILVWRVYSPYHIAKCDRDGLLCDKNGIAK